MTRLPTQPRRSVGRGGGAITLCCAPDGRSVRLALEEMKVGFVHELHLDGVRAADGRPVLHGVAYYTLNRLP